MATEQRRLQSYIIQQVLKHQHDIAPELLDTYVGGTDEAEVDRSIEKAKAASAALVQRARTEMAQAPPGFTQPVQEGVSDLDAQAIRDMSLEDYAAFRVARGIGQAKDQGIFAGLR